jgi:hypothetical protein
MAGPAPGAEVGTGAEPARSDPAGTDDRGAAETGPGRKHRVRGPRWLPDALVTAGYLVLAVLLTSGQWRRPERLFHQENDQMLFEWMLARAARAVTGLDNPLHSTALNAPDGVNLMANTSVLGLGVPLAPVTLLAGSQVTYLVAVIVSLAGTATGWYLLLSRRLVRSRVAAAVGGLFCGFAPGMIAQAGGHLHMIAQFLVPAILAIVFRPATDRTLRQGILLGLLVAYQVFLGEEVLFFAVLAAGLFTVAYAVADRPAARRLAPAFLGRLGTGALVAGILLAYPLWFQFFGPGHYQGLPFDPHSYQLDLASFTASARQTILGDVWWPGYLSPNPTEENSFFGPGLLVFGVLVVVWLRRLPLVRALAVCGLVFALLGLGPELRLNGEATGIPGPYRLIAGLPLIDLAVPARFPLICIPVLAILVALALDRFLAAPREAGAGVGTVPVRLVGTGIVAAVLLPLVPTPIRTVQVWPVPEFVASGEFRSYVPTGRTLVPVPPVTDASASQSSFWQARTNLAFTAPGGYFIGPRSSTDATARWGAPDRPTSALLRRVASTGEVPPIGDAERQQAMEDLRHWRAAIVVQGGLHLGWPVKETVDRLLGPGREISGAWVWDVRDRVD